MANIGFIGLGNMGLPMAANLVKGGHEVTGFDTVPTALENAKTAGVTIAKSAAEAAAGRDIVITMLPSGGIVLSVFAEIVPAAGKGTLIIESSTIDVASARKAHKMAAEKGLLCLDAPVSGGVGGATAATLTFMIGGSKEAFEKAKPVLELMGKRLVHCGPGGDGQAAKICNNMLLGISMLGACEAFALAVPGGSSAEAARDRVVGLAARAAGAALRRAERPRAVPGEVRVRSSQLSVFSHQLSAISCRFSVRPALAAG